MYTTSVWSVGRPVTRALLACLAVASLGLNAIQASPAHAAAPVVPGADAPQPIRIKPIQATINLLNGSDPRVEGTELRFSIHLKNANTSDDYSGKFTVFPSDSNIQGVKFVQADQPSCRWKDWPVEKQDQTCEGNPAKNWKLFHRITAEDVQRGYFEATATFDLSSDDLGKQKIAETTTARLRVPITQNSNPVTPPAPPVADKGIKVEWNRVDSLGDTATLGDSLIWELNVTNEGSNAGTAYPHSGNVEGFLIRDGQRNCRWIGLNPGQSYTCTVHHIVSSADLAQGTFTPEVRMDLTEDKEGHSVRVAGEVVTGAPVAFKKLISPDVVTLAGPGQHGFTCHRIPALTTAPNGWLLAAWDGRPDGCADAPNPNSIMQWISKDGGKTWEKEDLKVIAAGNKTSQAMKQFGYSDPSYVVDRQEKKIFMFFVKSFDKGLRDSQQGTDESNRNVLHAAVIESSDNGKSWSEPKVITADIQPEQDSAGRVWFSRFAASGEGIQKRFGPNKGRLIQQFTFKSEQGNSAVSVHSDDHGKTWKAGKPVGTGMDENKVVELSDGRLMLNSRRSDHQKNRLVAISTDGGDTWTDLKAEPSLIDPNNNASITRAFPEAEQGSACAKVLLFSNASSTGLRSNGVVSASLDDGKTWTQALNFERREMQYSTITPLAGAGNSLNSGKYGILYESYGPAITYKSFSFDQLNIDQAKKQELLETCVAKEQAPSPSQPPGTDPQQKPGTPQQPPANPTPTPQPDVKTRTDAVGSVTRVSGESRVETAVAIAKADFKDGAKVAILARADIHADAAAAVPLAKHLNAPVLLSQPDVLHPKALEELKRLKAEKVVVMGGKAAISEKAEAELVKAGFKVERVAGENRAATAVATAKALQKVDKVKLALLADGADWQPTMIAGPAAAKAEGVVLLTNGKMQAPETAKYLAEIKAQTVAIGDAARATAEAKDAVTAASPVALSLAVADRFFNQEAPAVGIATTADFADALTGGAHIARRNGPLLLSDTKLPDALVTWVRGANVTRSVFVYGGEARLTDDELARIAGK